MRLLIPALLTASALGLSAQGATVSVVRQVRATSAEFTLPWTDGHIRDGQDQVTFHLGFGLGLRHWDDGDTAVRVIADSHALLRSGPEGIFVSAGLVGEVPEGEKLFLGPRLRIGWPLRTNMALSLDLEHLERPFADGIGPRRRSAAGVAFTVKF